MKHLLCARLLPVPCPKPPASPQTQALGHIVSTHKTSLKGDQRKLMSHFPGDNALVIFTNSFPGASEVGKRVWTKDVPRQSERLFSPKDPLRNLGRLLPPSMLPVSCVWRWHWHFRHGPAHTWSKGMCQGMHMSHWSPTPPHAPVTNWKSLRGWACRLDCRSEGQGSSLGARLCSPPPPPPISRLARGSVSSFKHRNLTDLTAEHLE